jgi:hypothetical protein
MELSRAQSRSEGKAIHGFYAALRFQTTKIGPHMPCRSSRYEVELIINVNTAKALGIRMPLPLTGRADELIE